MTFAEKLRELRNQAGLSEAKLAKASGIPFGTIHKYGTEGEEGRKPSFQAVVKIARALGTTCEVFADCEGMGDAQESEAPAPKPAKRKPRGKGK